jgi:hypothetical protein
MRTSGFSQIVDSKTLSRHQRPAQDGHIDYAVCSDQKPAFEPAGRADSATMVRRIGTFYQFS